MFVAVSSVARSQGNTMLACNIAVALAGMGKKILLIDAGLRPDALHFGKRRIGSLGGCELGLLPWTGEVQVGHLQRMREGVDVVVLDVGLVGSRTERDILCLSDEIILPISMISADREVMMDAYQLACWARLINPRINVRMVLNFCNESAEHGRGSSDWLRAVPGDAGPALKIGKRKLLAELMSEGLAAYDVPDLSWEMSRDFRQLLTVIGS